MRTQLDLVAVERGFRRLVSIVRRLMSLLGVAYVGVVFSCMWEWFVPLSPVGLWQGVGIVLIVKLLFADYAHLMDKYMDEVFDDEPWRRLLWETKPTFITTSFIWLMGWIMHYKPWELVK
jgi:hypothetical protein